MYFRNRAEAGRKLAKELTKYQRKNSVVLALNPGGVMVGAQIAMKLHTDLFMLLAERVHVPGEPVAIGSVSSDNSFVYNPAYSSGQIEELAMEYHGLIESERMAKIHKLHMVMGSAGEVPRDLLKRRVVILVSDGLHDGFDLSVAAHFLKPVNVQRLVLAVPIASVPAVDAMHLFGDEIHCLYVAEFLFETDHYYDDNIVPDADGLHKIMRNTPLNWHFSNV